MTDAQKLGPTGKFPKGKIDETDEGEIAVGIITDEKTRTVILNFGKSIQWIGMKPEGAMKLAMLLVKHARQLGLDFDKTLENMSLEPKNKIINNSKTD